LVVAALFVNFDFCSKCKITVSQKLTHSTVWGGGGRGQDFRKQLKMQNGLSQDTAHFIARADILKPWGREPFWECIRVSDSVLKKGKLA
jgi:hypothetical protein